MSNNRFKNLVFDNKSNDEKKEPPKLKENSRWKRAEGDSNRFKSSNNRDGNRENYRTISQIALRNSGCLLYREQDR